jgi:hypothetical protein
LIELAYLCGESLGLSIWTQDEAGPFQTKPYGGSSWAPDRAVRIPDEPTRRTFLENVPWHREIVKEMEKDIG